MRKLRIAVMSDLHVGENARAADLRPSDPTGDGEFRNALMAFLSEAGKPSDYLIIPGDVAELGDPDEVLLASGIVADAASVLEVPDNHIMFVPGNHDVDWAVLELSSNELRRRQRYDPLQQDECVFSQVMERGECSLLEEPYFCVWETDDVIVAGYNTSHHDNPDIAVHYGVAERSHLESLGTHLETCDLSGERVRLLLVHHHVESHWTPDSDDDSDDRDFSAMQNSREFIQLASQFEFDVVIHGHTHVPHFNTRAHNSQPPFGLFSAGSLSFALPQHWGGIINNQMHFLDIAGRDSHTQRIQAVIESWAYYSPHGWVPSREKYDGIPHHEPFGCYPLPQELRDALNAVLTGLFHSRDWCSWKHVLEADPNLAYVRPSLVIATLGEIAGGFGFQIHPSDDPDQRWLLLKEEES